MAISKRARRKKERRTSVTLHKYNIQFEDAIEEVLRGFQRRKMTLEEISDTYKVDINFLKALVHEDKEIITNISKLFRGSGTLLYTRRDPQENVKLSYRRGMIYVLRRKIEPLSFMDYDPITKTLSNFRLKHKINTVTETQRQYMIEDFEEYVNKKFTYK